MESGLFFHHQTYLIPLIKKEGVIKIISTPYNFHLGMKTK